MNPLILFAGGAALGAVFSKQAVKLLQKVKPMSETALDTLTKQVSELVETGTDWAASVRPRRSTSKGSTF